MARTNQEKMVDRLFTLYIIHRCRAEHGLSCISKTKMHKLLFYAQKTLIDNKIKAMNYSFVKVLYPTFSSELRSDLTDLTEQGFLNGDYYREQEKAERILEDFQEIFDRNSLIKSLIDREVDQYAPMETSALVVKTKKVPWRGKTIGALRKGTPLLSPLEPQNVSVTLDISEEELEQLEICLSPVVAEKISRADEDLQRGKRLTYEEVFGKLC